MDFFESQEVARRKTGLLVSYFFLAVALMILALYAVVIGLFTVAGQQDAQTGVDWWRPEILLGVAAVTLAVIGLGSLYKTIELRAGGQRIATMLGGRRLNPNSAGLDEQRLLNVVEEMALAAGTPVPPVYLLDNERSINAFAAGFTPNDAVIGVNRGTLDYLSRDELQGVIGHEFSHILNGDMRLNLRLIGLLNGILMLAVIGYYLMRFGGGSSRRSSDRDRGGGQIVILGLAALVIGYVGLFFARLIKAAVSREREYLADASAVQFTRNPDGIAGALTKIGGLAAGSRMESPEAETASHMFFGSFRQAMFGALSTHPPLVQRIQRINPRFDGKFPRTLPLQPHAARRLEKEAAAAAGGPRVGPSGPPRKLAVGEKLPLDPLLAMAAVGTLSTQHVAYANELIRALPAALKSAVRDAFSARAVIFAMLLDDEADVRARQLELLRRQLGAPTEEETVKLAPLVAAAGAVTRLPLIEIVQSTLQGLSPGQFQAFCRAVDDLSRADQKQSLFEFVLQRVLIRHLQRHFSGAKPARVRYPAINGVRREAADLISALAYLGQVDPSDARRAFDLAVAMLSVNVPVPMRSRNDLSFRAIGDALDKLAQTSPPIKKRVLNAAIVAVTADGKVTVGEAELLRAVSTMLDCPMPPLFAGPIET